MRLIGLFKRLDLFCIKMQIKRIERIVEMLLGRRGLQGDEMGSRPPEAFARFSRNLKWNSSSTSSYSFLHATIDYLGGHPHSALAGWEPSAPSSLPGNAHF